MSLSQGRETSQARSAGKPSDCPFGQNDFCGGIRARKAIVFPYLGAQALTVPRPYTPMYHGLQGVVGPQDP